jgi:glycosyltransferase involved in cell wall biosynthesis
LQHSFRQRIESIKHHYSKPGPNVFRFIYYTFSRTFFEMPSLRRAQGLLAGSETTRAEYLNHYGIPAEKIALTPHGIDTSFFRKAGNTNKIRESLGFPDDVPIILFVGFITPRKGLEYLIQAIGQLSPKPLLLLVGRWISDKYRERVLKIAGPYRNQIVELGYLPDEQMPTYYTLADLYASSSLLEGFGIPIIEAMSCQTPVVVADTGSSAEVTGPGGFLTKPGDVDDLSEKINILLKDKELRLEKGILGRDYVEKKFSLNNMVYSTLEAYASFQKRS